LRYFLDLRSDIVETIEDRLLNVRDKNLSRCRDRQVFEQLLQSCFFGDPRLPAELSRLKGRLTAAHLADGFEPVLLDRYAQTLDPLELIVRAYEYWDARRWPGRSGRSSFAQTIFVVFVVGLLEHLSLRIWDAGPDTARENLASIQDLLDRLNSGGSRVALVRNAAWLIQTAQGPLTRHLEPYFAVARRIDESFSGVRGVDIHQAGAVLVAGHLRSQWRYRVWNSGKAMDDPELLAFNRNSNAMDGALLVGDLVSLLEAYDAACEAADTERRLNLADAILQGLSADPELLVLRWDLLEAYGTIETLAGVPDDTGRLGMSRHAIAFGRQLDRYRHVFARVAERLRDDAGAFDPSTHAYSPYGIVYGFCADLFSNIAMSSLAEPSADGLALEDAFVSLGRNDEKLRRAERWTKLPRRAGEREHFEHSREWAQQIFEALRFTLALRARRPGLSNASDRRNARIVVRRGDRGSETRAADATDEPVENANEYCFSSDMQHAVSLGATFQPAGQMLDDRGEARFLASGEVNGHHFGVSKLLLTTLIAQGKDALLTNVPSECIETLRLLYPLVVR
jgi:hypothetical protein